MEIGWIILRLNLNYLVKCKMVRNVMMLLILSNMFLVSMLNAAPMTYPQKVEIITKSQANYKTPENTLSARSFALLSGDILWFNKTMTKQDLLKEIKDFADAGIDRKKICEMEKNIRTVHIVEKVLYKDAVILVVEAFSNEGSVLKTPLQFVQEGGLWKFTNKYSADVEVQAYIDYVILGE